MCHQIWILLLLTIFSDAMTLCPSPRCPRTKFIGRSVLGGCVPWSMRPCHDPKLTGCGLSPQLLAEAKPITWTAPLCLTESEHNGNGNILVIYEHLTQLSPVGHGCSLRQNPEATFLAGAVQILTTGEGSCKPAPPQISAVAEVYSCWSQPHRRDFPSHEKWLGGWVFDVLPSVM